MLYVYNAHYKNACNSTYKRVKYVVFIGYVFNYLEYLVLEAPTFYIVFYAMIR